MWSTSDNHHEHKAQRSECKLQRSGSASACRIGMQQQHATPTTTTIYWPAQDQHGRCWSARCSNHCNLCKSTQFKFLPCSALMQVWMIATSCTPTAPVLILSWSLYSGGVWNCMVFLHPLWRVLVLVLTFAPSMQTFAPSGHGSYHGQQLTVVVFLPQLLAQMISIAHMVVSHWIALVVFLFNIPTGADTVT